VQTWLIAPHVALRRASRSITSGRARSGEPAALSTGLARADLDSNGCDGCAMPRAALPAPTRLPSTVSPVRISGGNGCDGCVSRYFGLTYDASADGDGGGCCGAYAHGSGGPLALGGLMLES